MFNQDITIYNSYEDEVTGFDKYKRTYIPKAHWENSVGVKLGDMIISKDDSIDVVIPYDTEGYILPSEWDKLENKENYWTLKAHDFIAKGNILEEITGFKDLEHLYDVLTIKSVETNNQARIKRLNNFTVNGK